MHASEGMHWYTRDGKPAYTVTGKDGFERPATLRDARKLNLVPSVTTIIKCAAAPGLERWKQDQVLHSALTLPRGDGEAEAAWIERVWTDSKETARKASERGTAIHAAIQNFYLTGQCERPMYPHIESACEAIAKWSQLDTECAMVEQSFGCPLGFGGKVDFSCTAPYIVVDFKTKEFDTEADLKTWDSHWMQLAAYRAGLEMPKARCAIVYVSVNNPGLSQLIEITEEELQKGWRMFLGLLQFWQARAGYNSSWLPEQKAA